jgi:hypothetical protein
MNLDTYPILAWLEKSRNAPDSIKHTIHKKYSLHWEEFEFVDKDIVVDYYADKNLYIKTVNIDKPANLQIELPSLIPTFTYQCSIEGMTEIAQWMVSRVVSRYYFSAGFLPKTNKAIADILRKSKSSQDDYVDVYGDGTVKINHLLVDGEAKEAVMDFVRRSLPDEPQICECLAEMGMLHLASKILKGASYED